MHARNKTQRKRAIGGAASTMAPGIAANVPFAEEEAVKATENSLDALFAAETTATFQQTWQKLDRGSRLDRLRKYVQGYPDLTPAERASLLTAVLQAFELRQLNTKAAVEYDPDTAAIISIRGLRERVSASGLKTFRIDAAPAAVRATQRAKKVSTATDAAAGST